MSTRRVVAALAAAAIVASGGTAAGLALSGASAPAPSRSSVSGCAAAIATGEESGTMTRDSPMPPQCAGLTRAQLAEAVGDALSTYVAHQETASP